MAKYNLMNNQRPDYFDRYYEEDQQKKEPKDQADDQDALDLNVSSESDDMFDDSLFSAKKDEQSIDQDIEEAAPLSTETADEHPPATTGDKMTMEAGRQKKILSDYGYGEDDSFEYESRGGKGTFLKFLIILILLAGGIYLVINYVPQVRQLSFFSKDGAGQSEQDQSSTGPENKLKSEQDIRREDFLKSVNSLNKNKLSYITTLLSLKSSDIHYSSLFLYGNTLNLEIFGSQRDDIARFNMKLRRNNYIKDYNIQSTDTRPGRNGGIFSLFNITVADKYVPGENIQIADNLKSPGQWLAETTNKYNLTVKSQRTISTKNENLFRVSRNEYILRGNKDKCFSLINEMAAANYNFSIYKLILIPSNQRDIVGSTYQLNLIMDFYMK